MIVPATSCFRRSCILAIVMALGVSACDKPKSESIVKPAPAQYTQIDWSQLTPANWDAMALLKGIDLSKMQDSDPRAFDLLKNVRDQWNNAPVIESWDGHAVSIIGYVAPLDGDAEHVKEFLLVPYFGACIHSPPPPSNQVIHVHIVGSPIPFTNWDAYVTVSGILQVQHSDMGIGVAGYQMQAHIVTPFKELYQ